MIIIYFVVTGDMEDEMELAAKPSAEVDSRVPEQPGFISRGNERVSPETSGETRAGRPHDTPPISTCSMRGNLALPDAGLPSSADTGRGSSVRLASGFGT